jgi:hypothetical protein
MLHHADLARADDSTYLLNAAAANRRGDVYRAVKAAFQGGAHGVLLSRKYSEMRLANLGGAGKAIREVRPA